MDEGGEAKGEARKAKGEGERWKAKVKGEGGRGRKMRQRNKLFAYVIKKLYLCSRKDAGISIQRVLPADRNNNRTRYIIERTARVIAGQNI